MSRNGQNGATARGPDSADLQDPLVEELGSEALALAEDFDKKHKLLSIDQIRSLMKMARPVGIGVMGWCAKVGATPARPAVPAKGRNPAQEAIEAIPGMRISGQIVQAFTLESRFRDSHGKTQVQPVVIIDGVYTCPGIYDKDGVEIEPPCFEQTGRRLLGIDASLVDLPHHVGDVVDVELTVRGGTGKRHVYSRIDCYSLSSFFESKTDPAAESAANGAGTAA